MNVSLRKPSPRRVPPALCTHSSAWRRVIIPAAPLGESLLQWASRPLGHCTSSRVSPGGHLALGSRVFSRLRAAHPFPLRLPFSGILEMSPGPRERTQSRGWEGPCCHPCPNSHRASPSNLPGTRDSQRRGSWCLGEISGLWKVLASTQVCYLGGRWGR